MSNCTPDFCFNLPKVELHAHLNTSFSAATLQALVNRKAAINPECQHWKLNFNNGEVGTFEQTFEMFKLIHKVCNDADSIYKLTYDIIHEFAKDNVKYLEIRSTPKNIPETGLTFDLYMDSMLRAVGDCEAEGVDIVVRLLPSIDRRNSVAVAEQTVALAAKYAKLSKGVVVGIDLSGDPKVGDAADFIPALKSAQAQGLKVSAHLAEVPSFVETMKVLKEAPPDRIGHGTFLHRFGSGIEHQEIEELVLKHKIPIEVCMTSNVTCKSVEDYASHHLEFWRKKDHPIIICTDGKGVFSCTTSEEYFRAAETFGFSQEELFQISLQSLDHVFDGSVKERLRRKWEDAKPQLLAKPQA